MPELGASIAREILASRQRGGRPAPPEQADKLAAALDILLSVGIPVHLTPARQAEKTACAFLALADVSPGTDWSKAADLTSHELTTRGIIRWVRAHYEDPRSDSSYDYVLRNDLMPLLRAGYVQSTGQLAGKSYNDSTRGYGLEPAFAELVRKYGTRKWKRSHARFMKGRVAFDDLPERQRDVAMEVRFRAYQGDEVVVGLGPGGHNELVKVSVEDFLARVAGDARVLYVGDADDRDLFRDTEALRELGVDLEDLLPDVLAVRVGTGPLWVIEAVHSRGPVSEAKKGRFDALLGTWARGVVYVTTFRDRATFRKHVADIAWGTEVWLADEPDHVIHFNGDDLGRR